jgi:vancomycin resistance protein YoaR
MTKWYHIVVGRSILHINIKPYLNTVHIRRLGWVLLSCVAVFVGVVTIYFLFFTNKVYPNTSVAGVQIGGLSVKDAATLLSSNIKKPEKIQLTGAGQPFTIESKDFDLSYNYTESAERAYNLYRTGNFFYDLTGRVEVLFHPINIGVSLDFDNDKLDRIISVISGQISIEPVDPSISLTDGGIVINRGAAGTEVDTNSLRNTIGAYISMARTDEIVIPIYTVDNTLNESEAQELRARAEKYIGKSLELKFEYNTYTLSDKDLVKTLDYRSGFNDESIETIAENIAGKVNREPQNSKFVFENGRVTEFQPSLDGIQTDIEELKIKLTDSLSTIEFSDDKTSSIDIPTQKTPPEITTDKINNLGIKELIGRGTSTYFHSISSRVHNVVLAASRINGTLVKPGDTFSFNNTLGDVSAFTGYQQAYIISGGKTILGDGGGVCQVSTTLFRAILNAGLPVIERQAHAYRVGYYEQDSPPGIDATVYAPSPDLKFKNDTPAYILIEAKADPKNYSLTFELYGASDGRVASMSKPVVTNVSAPPEDLYQDDPTLPAGTVKQIDFKAWGAKVSFNYIVKRDGSDIYSKTFVSNYRPWQAVYLRGTGPAI